MVARFNLGALQANNSTDATQAGKYSSCRFIVIIVLLRVRVVYLKVPFQRKSSKNEGVLIICWLCLSIAQESQQMVRAIRVMTDGRTINKCTLSLVSCPKWMFCTESTTRDVETTSTLKWNNIRNSVNHCGREERSNCILKSGVFSAKLIRHQPKGNMFSGFPPSVWQFFFLWLLQNLAKTLVFPDWKMFSQNSRFSRPGGNPDSSGTEVPEIPE